MISNTDLISRLGPHLIFHVTRRRIRIHYPTRSVLNQIQQQSSNHPLKETLLDQTCCHSLFRQYFSPQVPTTWSLNSTHRLELSPWTAHQKGQVGGGSHCHDQTIGRYCRCISKMPKCKIFSGKSLSARAPLIGCFLVKLKVCIMPASIEELVL